LVTDVPSFALQVRQDDWENWASVVVAAATMMGGNRIAIYTGQARHLYINGHPVAIERPPSIRVPDPARAAIGDWATSSPGRLVLDDGTRIVLDVVDGVSTYTLAGPNGCQLMTIGVRPKCLEISATYSLGRPAIQRGCESQHEPRAYELGQPLTFRQLNQKRGDSWRVGPLQSLFDEAPLGAAE
jgi:hypothetical protein